MPPEFYRRSDLLELERERIFATAWLCPGFAADVPNPGDYLTFTINDQPVFVVRGDDGQLRSFSNVCLHRMMRLVEMRGNCRTISCPYHGWCYDLHGRLLSARDEEDAKFSSGQFKTTPPSAPRYGKAGSTSHWTPTRQVLWRNLRPSERSLVDTTCRAMCPFDSGSRLAHQLEAAHGKLYGGLPLSRRSPKDARQFDAARQHRISVADV